MTVRGRGFAVIRIKFMPNRVEGGGFPAKQEQPKKQPEESFADVSKELGLGEKPPVKEEKPPVKEEKPKAGQAPGSIEEALLRQAAKSEAEFEGGGLPAKQEQPKKQPEESFADVSKELGLETQDPVIRKRLEDEIKTISARLPDMKSRATALEDALKAGFGQDIKTAKQRNWFLGLFDNFNKIVKEYDELIEKIAQDEYDLKAANMQIHDPRRYEKEQQIREAGRAAIRGAAEGAKPGKTGGFGTLKG